MKESQDKVSVTPEEAKRRLEILRKRPELQKLHMSLVGGGLISDAQFWLGIRYRLDRSEQKLLDNGLCTVSCVLESSKISIRRR